MWILRYLNGFGDLEEFKFQDLDEAYAHLKAEFDVQEGPFAFKLKYEGKQ